MGIVKGEDCTLLDNSRRTRWRVRNSSGIEGLVPSICFFIPPPNKDAEELANTYVMALCPPLAGPTRTTAGPRNNLVRVYIGWCLGSELE